MAVINTDPLLASRCPAEPIDPSLAWVDYDVPSDEVLVFCGGKPVPTVSDLLDAPRFRGVAAMLELDAAGNEMGEIVGVQVIPMLLGAVQEQPHWAVLAWAAMAGYFGTELLRERLPGFLAEVEPAFRQYWTLLRPSRSSWRGLPAGKQIPPAGAIRRSPRRLLDAVGIREGAYAWPTGVHG